MKNSKILIPILLLVALIGNLFLFYALYNKQLNTLKESAFQQNENIVSSIEKVGFNFQSDINYILYSDDIINIFKSGNNAEVLAKIKVFYTKYGSFVSSILVYDNNYNTFSLYRDKKDNFLSDMYVSRKQNTLYTKDNFIYSGSQFFYIVPIFRQNDLVGNIMVNIDVPVFFENYFHNNIVSVDFPCLIANNTDSILFSNEILRKSEKAFSEILKTKKNELDHSFQSKVLTNDNNNNFCSVYTPFNLFNGQYLLVSSINLEHFFSNFLIIAITAILLNVILLVLVTIIYFKDAKNRKMEEQKLRESEEAFKQIIELLPIGIIILNAESKIVSINLAASKILMVDPLEDLIGIDISHRFFNGKTLMIDQEYSSAYDTNHFLHYEADGQEIVIYKKDIPIKLKGEDLLVQSFIDVTPIEKSRKREIAANMAKSEFLARMSHEIRTPMNGIIGMADSLSTHKLTEEQSEQVMIIKKSADLLLSILNDILDLSKIEAGKMMLEEIPFKLKEEIQLASDLFRVAAEEKGIKIRIEFEKELQNNYIGDPFRLRQIIINLIGNAVKFTQEGEIVITVSKIEEYNCNLMLQFMVQDTGIGIPFDKLNNIFNSFSQADSSTTRKYGGTGLGTAISKQLVELMNGEIFVESPSGISKNPKFPGSKFAFTIELYSNEHLIKKFNYSNITSFTELKTLIIGENKPEEQQFAETLTYFNVPVEQQTFTRGTIDMLKANSLSMEDNIFKLLIIKDSPTFDGFKLLGRMKEAHLIDRFPIVMVSNNDKVGNYVKSKRNGVDHYIIYPFETSEVFNIIYETFPSLKVEDDSIKVKVQKLREDIRILVAEDNAINQKVAKTLFKNIGYEIVFAKNGLEVLEMVEKNEYDIIFMDIMMPEMDGLHATVELRQKGVKIPIIAMTANIAKDEKQNAINAGMNDYITKPVRIDTVKKILIKLFSEDV